MDIVWLAAAAAFFGGCRALIKLLNSLQSEE
jgi:hypothetical protein